MPPLPHCYCRLPHAVDKQGHFDDLADLIELAEKNYTIVLPTCILTTLRAILYLFNGSSPERVVISNDGFTENKYIYAESATWTAVRDDLT